MPGGSARCLCTARSSPQLAARSCHASPSLPHLPAHHHTVPIITPSPLSLHTITPSPSPCIPSHPPPLPAHHHTLPPLPAHHHTLPPHRSLHPSSLLPPLLSLPASSSTSSMLAAVLECLSSVSRSGLQRCVQLTWRGRCPPPAGGAPSPPSWPSRPPAPAWQGPSEHAACLWVSGRDNCRWSYSTQDHMTARTFYVQ